MKTLRGKKSGRASEKEVVNKRRSVTEIRFEISIAHVILIAALALGSMECFGQQSGGASLQTVETSPRLPSKDELNKFFMACVQSRPGKVRLRVVSEILEPPAPESRIEERLRDIMEFLKVERSDRSSAELDELREANLQSLRGFHDGYRVYVCEIWRSGPLYRIDQNEMEASVGENLETILAGEPISKYTFVNIDDPDFGEYATYDLNHMIKSATVSKNPAHRVAVNEYWNALGMEPELMVDLVLAMGDVSTVKGLTLDTLDRMAIDPVKVEQLAEGRHQRVRMTVSVGRYRDHDVHEFTLQGIPPSMGEKYGFVQTLSKAFAGRKDWLISQGINQDLEQLFMKDQAYASKASYIVDRTNYHRLYRARVEVAVPKITYTSERREFDGDEFPHFWEVTKTSPEKEFETQRLRFESVDLKGQFDDRAVFAFSAPTNYLVADGTTGIGKIIQNPVPWATEGPRREGWLHRLRRPLSMLILLAVTLLPVAYLAGKNPQRN